MDMADSNLQNKDCVIKPGRSILLNENKEEVKKGLVSRIFVVAREYFFEGLKR